MEAHNSFQKGPPHFLTKVRKSRRRNESPTLSFNLLATVRHSTTLSSHQGKEKLNYPMDKEVYVVLEEDGTEVDEEEYFQTLPENTLLMLLHVGDRWSPYGPPFT